MLIGDEIIAQPLYRNAPLLAYQAQIVLLEGWLHLLEALFHFATVGEQREHGTLLGAMGSHEKPLQGGQICRVVRFGHIADNVDGHLVVEIVARCQQKLVGLGMLAGVQAHGLGEARELPVNGQRGGSKHHRVRVREPAPIKLLADVEQKRLQLVLGLVILAVQVRRVNVLLGALHADNLHRLENLLELHGDSGDLALNNGNPLDIVQIADKLLTCGNELFCIGGHFAGSAGNPLEHRGGAHFVVKPQIDVLIPFRAPIALKVKQIGKTRAECPRGIGELRTGVTRFSRQTVEERCRGFAPRHNDAPFSSNKNVPPRLLR